MPSVTQVPREQAPGMGGSFVRPYRENTMNPTPQPSHLRAAHPGRGAAAGAWRAGFTLIELSVVVFIIGMVAAVAFPRLLPVLAFSEAEGSSRHLANFGRASIAQAALLKEDVTFYFDFDKQQFWVTRWVVPDPTSEMEGEAGLGEEGDPNASDQIALLNQFQAGSGFSAEEISQMLLSGQMAGADGMPEGFDQELADAQIGSKFDKMARRALETRAKNVIQGDGLLDEIGPLFDKEFSLSDDADTEPYEEEITDPVIRRSTMPETVSVTQIFVNGERFSKGVLDIPISPLGLQDEVIFNIGNAEGDVYSVVWDPILNNADLLDGEITP